MAEGNSLMGTLTDSDAVAMLMKNAMVDEAQDEGEPDEDQDDLEAGEEAESEADEIETLEADDESEEAEDDDATGDDTAEDIDADELKKGYLRQSDYTRKTQEVAAERAKLASERSEFETQAQQQLDQLSKAVAAFSIPTEAEPNWPELARTLEPKAYQTRQAEWADKQGKARQAKELHERIQDVTHQQNMQREAQAIFDRVPEWRDGEIAKRETAEMARVAGEYGYSVDEANAITDHRQVLILRELMLIKRQQKAADQKQATPKRKIKAAAAPVKVDVQEKKQRDLTARLSKSGSVDDAAALLMQRARV